MNLSTQSTSVIDYSLMDRDKPICILAVEDDPLSMMFLETQIHTLGHNCISAYNGEMALDELGRHRDKIDVIIMDRQMPVMDGLTAIKKMKESPSLRNIPVIMVTGSDSLADMKAGLDAGVFYYLTKPVKEEMLRSVVESAVRMARRAKTLREELGRHRTGFRLMEACKFRYRTLDEGESLAAFLANSFPEPERTLTGLGELMINAVEHGTLGIGYTRKTQLVADRLWRSEIEHMQHMSQYQDKYVEVAFSKKDDGFYVVITDQGNGFDWRKYLQIDPARTADGNGRGIAQANAISFDKLAYNERGNQAVAFVSFKPQLQW